MSESASTVTSEPRPFPRPQDGPLAGAGGAPAGAALPVQPLSFKLKLQSRKVLLTVLVTVARLGGEVAYLLARGVDVRMTLLLPGHTAHRVEPLLGGIIGVVAVSKLSAGRPTSSE